MDNTLQQFLNKNQQKLSKSIALEKIQCNILSISNDDLQKAAKQIQEGKLVSFPTETVYGLGADALNPTAVTNIFKTKRRPFTDPVIVHVTTMQQALDLINVESDDILQNFLYLSEKLWPGALTFILKANFDKIDRIITAQTDYVGIRMPNHPIAQQLINLSGKPIAAPSANLFSHVSPTLPVHVFNDFYDKDLSIIDGESCEFGIESTVIKIKPNNEIQILRCGSIDEKTLKQILEEKHGANFQITKLLKKVQADDQAQNQEAPGMLLKHYSPLLESYLFEVVSDDKIQQLSQQNKTQEIQSGEQLQYLQKIGNIQLSDCIILDFCENAKFLQDKCLKYQQMSDSEDLKQVMNKLYDLLRWSENVEQAKWILISDLNSYYQNQQQKPEFFDTVFDKIFRSTSGKKLYINQSDLSAYSQ